MFFAPRSAVIFSRSPLWRKASMASAGSPLETAHSRIAGRTSVEKASLRQLSASTNAQLVWYPASFSGSTTAALPIPLGRAPSLAPAPSPRRKKDVDLASVSEPIGQSSVATTVAIYSHAIRDKDRATA